MKHNIHEDIIGLATPVENIKLLPNNPRHGDVNSVVASYAKFGQTKPIVAVEDEDGTLTVIAGNHQLLAVKELGWTHIAVSKVPFDESMAAAYALADNRTSELGTTDDAIVFEMLTKGMEDHADLFEALHWDEYDMAAMEPLVTNDEPSPANIGWEPPKLIKEGDDEDEDDDQLHFTGDKALEKDLITSGSTAAGISGSSKRIVQYTIAFESQAQQARWYDFIRFLKGHRDDYPGDTTGTQLIAFIEKEVFDDNDEGTD